MTNSNEPQFPTLGPEYVKVIIELPDEGEGYPPVSTEGVWAVKLDETRTRVRVENIPFYAQGVSCGDIVRVRENEFGQLVFQEVLEPSGNSTFQLYIFDVGDVQAVRDDLRRINCESEGSDIPKLIAVEVPADVSIRPFLNYIAAAANAGRLEYQEAALRHEWPE